MPGRPADDPTVKCFRTALDRIYGDHIARVVLSCIAVVFIARAGTSVVAAESVSPIKRTVLQKFDVPGTNYL
jgi:hypothetical protein